MGNRRSRSRAPARTALPVSFDHSDAPFGFASIKVLDLTGWSGSVVDARFEQLLASLTVSLGPPTVTPSLVRIQRLIKGLTSGELRDRELALEALKEMHENAAPAVPALLQMLAVSADASVRVRIIEVFARVGLAVVAPAIPQLAKLVSEDPDPDVRKTAARDLGWITKDTDCAITVLIESAKHDPS